LWGRSSGRCLPSELTKHLVGITRRTGDLFAVPLCAGIAIGRIGCFLTGPEDHTAGIATSLPWGINFGDGITRHPTQLYEIIFAIALGAFLCRRMKAHLPDGDVFKIFMVGYFTFRLACDFLKPDVRVMLGMSAIQWACLLMLVYYAPDITRWLQSRARTAERSGGPLKHLPHTEILR
jgi:phosphatidylglycerol:prolipoprotein diacylglycerol transferase